MLGRLLPLFGSDSFLNDLSEAGLPRMTSTALRWTPKRHHFTCPQHPTHQNNPTNGSKVRRGSIFSSSALPHFQPIRCTKWRFNLSSEGVNTFYGQKYGQKCHHLATKYPLAADLDRPLYGILDSISPHARESTYTLSDFPPITLSSKHFDEQEQGEITQMRRL